MSTLADLTQALKDLNECMPKPWTVVVHRSQVDVVRQLIEGEGYEAEVISAEHVEENMAYLFHEASLPYGGEGC